MKQRTYWFLVREDDLEILSEPLQYYSDAVSEKAIWVEDMPGDRYRIIKMTIKPKKR